MSLVVVTDRCVSIFETTSIGTPQRISSVARGMTKHMRGEHDSCACAQSDHEFCDSVVAQRVTGGYCGRPPQQDCPHPNACLTCPDFQTTPEFLPLHIRQRDDTLELMSLAERGGHGRLAANHRQVATNLQHVIEALEAIEEHEHR